MNPVTPDFQDAPTDAFVSALCTPFFICPDCRTPMTPTVAIHRYDEGATGVVIQCPCQKIWRIGFQTLFQVAEPSRLATAANLPTGLTPAGPVSRPHPLHT